jgi:uncharacterized repeat protein (TIGR02543 family)
VKDLSVEDDVVLYAVWLEKSYTITYELNGGVNSKKNPVAYTTETPTITLNDPTRDGYDFVGWYADKTFITKVSSIEKGSTGDVTLYAAWECQHKILGTREENRIEPGCEQAGSFEKVTFCKVCGKEISRNTVSCAATHEKTEVRNAKEATCSEEGYTGDTYCTICGELISTGKVIKKTAHNWDDGVVDQKPSYTTVGKKTYTCKDCGEKKTETIEKLKNPVKKVSRIQISGTTHQVAAGKKISLSATVLPANATNKKVVWTSGNTKIATVSQTGVVTMKKGTGGKKVIITASAADGSGKKAAYSITSMKGTVKKVAIRGVKPVKAGKSLKLKAKVTATGGANKTLKWTSSNTGYAQVSASGKVTTTKAGKGKTVTIVATATDGSGKKKAVKIKIK